jgi:hypothetical protein
MKTFLLLLLISGTCWGAKLSDYRPYRFEVLFTNPVCATYEYDRDVITHSGKTLRAKPDDVYCKASDEAASVFRRTAPQFRLIEWITAPDTREIHAAYLSFSSKNVAQALCQALRKGVKVTLVLDGGETGTATSKDAEALKACGPVAVTYRGSTGGLGFAHNKIMIVTPADAAVRKIVFSSGNLTTGTSINHENWNFVTTARASYFAQVHACVIDAMVESGKSRAAFSAHLNRCRSAIAAAPESDIKTFFVPTDGAQALEQVRSASARAREIEAMSHRLSGALLDVFAEAVAAGKTVKFLLDDDVYWAAALRKDVGRNTKVEAFAISNRLIAKGMQTRFLETNQSIYQLQHNKFMIYSFGADSGAVFTGAGNLTTSAFTKNFENFYYITIPEVVAAYDEQYGRYFERMATGASEMPRDYVLP